MLGVYKSAKPGPSFSVLCLSDADFLFKNLLFPTLSLTPFLTLFSPSPPYLHAALPTLLSLHHTSLLLPSLSSFTDHPSPPLLPSRKRERRRVSETEIPQTSGQHLSPLLPTHR